MLLGVGVAPLHGAGALAAPREDTTSIADEKPASAATEEDEDEGKQHGEEDDSFGSGLLVGTDDVPHVDENQVSLDVARSFVTYPPGAHAHSAPSLPLPGAEYDR